MLPFMAHNNNSTTFLIKTKKLNALSLYKCSSLNALNLLNFNLRIKYLNALNTNNLAFMYYWTSFSLNDFFLNFQNFIRTGFGLITSNLPKSCYYWNVRIMYNILSKTRLSKTTNNIFFTKHNSKLFRPNIVITFSFQKKAHDTFIIYLYFLLTDAHHANYQDFKLYYSYIYLPSNFQTITFLNYFYFKLRHF